MKIFEAYDMLAIENVMRPGDVYVEIGAHRGEFLTASHLLRGGCAYHLYEPGLVRVALAERMAAARLRCGADVRVHPEAIWSVAGEVAYHVEDTEAQGNTLVPGLYPAAGVVPAVTLEQALAGILSVRFLAINAEQGEYEILKSPAMAKVQFVTCEFHPGKSGVDTLAFVRDHLPQFRTLQFGRAGDAYNQWLGQHEGAAL